MASHAHMLLNPRAYKKQIPKNGEDLNAGLQFSPDPSHDSDFGPDIQHEPSSSLSSPIQQPATPANGPRDVDSEGSHQETGQKNMNHQQHGAASPVAPESVAHRLLSPQRPPSAHRASPMRSQYPSSTGSTSASSSPQPPSTMMPDLDFEFTNASDIDFSDGKRSVDLVDLDDDAGLRHGNLIENMYGVERRTGTPYKRVKMDNDNNEKTKRGPIAGNSGLGEYMKENDGETPSSTAITPDVVDLTLGKELLAKNLKRAAC